MFHTTICNRAGHKVAKKVAEMRDPVLKSEARAETGAEKRCRSGRCVWREQAVRFEGARVFQTGEALWD